jgi:excisionase family DNA binding protein
MHKTPTPQNQNTMPPPAPDQVAGGFINTATVAGYLACTIRTVNRLIERGYLPAIRLGPTGAYRIREADLHTFVATHGHHDPATVATSTPGTLPGFTPHPVTLATRRTPDGLLIVRPHQGN